MMRTNYKAHYLDIVLLRMLALPFAFVAGTLFCVSLVLKVIGDWIVEEGDRDDH